MTWGRFANYKTLIDLYSYRFFIDSSVRVNHYEQPNIIYCSTSFFSERKRRLTEEIRSLRLHRFLYNPDSQIKRFIKVLLPERIVLAARRSLYELNLTNKKTENMDDLKVELIKKFRPEVRNLSELLNRDFMSLWHYGSIG